MLVENQTMLKKERNVVTVPESDDKNCVSATFTVSHKVKILHIYITYSGKYPKTFQHINLYRNMLKSKPTALF